jgi:branched-chain amino acid transport system permease protein
MKLYTYIIGGAGCALVGAIVAIHLLRVQPAAAFSINWTGYLIFITVIGGVGTIEGPIIGTLIYFVLREETSQYGEWYFIVLGILAIVVVIWSPAGIYGYVVKKTNFFFFPLQRKVRFLSAGKEPEEIPAKVEA